jgi:hypothetical protein
MWTVRCWKQVFKCRVSVWLLHNTQIGYFSAISRREQATGTFDEMIMMPALYQTNTICLIFIVVAHWHNSPRVDTLSWFSANRSLFFLISAACLAEKQQIPNFIVFNRGSNPRSTALKTTTLTIAPETWLINVEMHTLCVNTK